MLCIDKLSPQLQFCAALPQLLRQLWQFYDVEFHLIRVQEAASIFPDVKAGVKCVLLFKEDKIQDTDAYTLFEHIIVLPFFHLISIHLGHIKERAGCPDIQFGQLDLCVDFRIIIHEYVYIQDSQLILFMYLPQERVQDLGFPDIGGIQMEHSSQEPSAGHIIFHDLFKCEINFGFHQKIIHRLSPYAKDN